MQIMDPHAALELLEYLRTAYPVFLLILFIVAFLANTILGARNANRPESPRMGPGGRPLPTRSRSSGLRKMQGFSKTVKRVFDWLSVAVLVTFLADATIYILHVMAARSEQWWRGQSTVVRIGGNPPSKPQICRKPPKKEKKKHMICRFKKRGKTISPHKRKKLNFQKRQMIQSSRIRVG